MVHSIRFRLAAATLFAAALVPLPLQIAAAGEKTAPTRLTIACCGGDADKQDAGLFEIVQFLHPRWTEESLRRGEDFALVYADMPGLPTDVYLLRVYASGEKSVATLVDGRGMEIPLEAKFGVVGKRSVSLYVDVLGLVAASGDDSAQDGPPSELELDLTCGDDNWIFVWWINSDGSIGWDADCCNDDC